jgi:hypothetical protein
MTTNRETAETILAVFLAAARDSGRILWSYSDLATAIGRPGQHRLLGAPLDEVRRLCEEREWPDIATVVVTKDSLLDGTLRPSPQALEKYGGWPGLRRAQARVIEFDWSSVQ